MTNTQKAARSSTFSDEERAAMKERAQEQRVAADKADGDGVVLAKIAEMTGLDRAMAERLHAVITTAVSSPSSKRWYGMPAYARDGKVVCFFQAAAKVKTRYATLGFSDETNLDEGTM